MLTEEQKALVDECVYLRGCIITSYRQIDFLLPDSALNGLQAVSPFTPSHKLRSS